MTDLPPTVAEYRIQIADETLDRVLDRVRSTHLGPSSRGAGWTYGLDAAWLRALVDYWGRSYDWRSMEAKLNQTPQYEAQVAGRRIHFAKISPQGRQAAPEPILLLHGWPYSYHTMLPLAERLASAGFEVIVPSLPGYVFSETVTDQVAGLRAISKNISALMTDVLGYDRYLVHGGDHGAVVADWLAIDTPQRLVGVHCHMIGFRHAGAGYGSGETGVAKPSPAEVAFAKAEAENIEKESAYFKLQLTRPETISYALSDSPVGWAAYMLDKWQKWSDTSSLPFNDVYDRDHLLTEVMLYALTDSVATSLWAYAGFATEPFGLEQGQTIDVPYAYSMFDDPLGPRPPREFMAHSRSDLRLWKDHRGGGHFPMLQQPDVLAQDIVEFARLVRA